MYQIPGRTPSRGPLLASGSWGAQSPAQGSFVGGQSPVNFMAQNSALSLTSPPSAPALGVAPANLALVSSNSLAPLVTASRTSSITRPLKGPAAHSAKVSNLECEDQQCAEEECDPEECGDEKRPPRDDNLVCGIDRRPFLPVVLASSTIVGAFHMMVLQLPLLREICDGADIVRAFFVVIYAVTLACMAYCALCDPGQLKEAANAAAALMNEKYAVADDIPVPKRAHKTWLYKLPIRRYDHYCRWLTNCIGLFNHREFVVMCTGLVSIGVFGGILDIYLMIMTASNGSAWVTGVLLLLHVTYSIMLTALAGPILRLHIGFICRNELANEWKRNDFYIVTSSKTGLPVPVNDLSDDEFNERFETFEYDQKRNIFDKGVEANCWAFWCTTRWGPAELGEF